MTRREPGSVETVNDRRKGAPILFPRFEVLVLAWEIESRPI